MMQLMTDFSIVIGALFSPHREDLCVSEHTFMCIQTGACVYLWIHSFHFFACVAESRLK